MQQEMYCCSLFHVEAPICTFIVNWWIYSKLTLVKWLYSRYSHGGIITIKTGSNKVNDKSPICTERTFPLCLKALFKVKIPSSHGNRIWLLLRANTWDLTLYTQCSITKKSFEETKTEAMVLLESSEPFQAKKYIKKRKKLAAIEFWIRS